MPLLDPTNPTDASSPTLGAADMRTIVGEVQQMFGGAGTAPVTFAVAPFITDTMTGLSTVPGPPTASLGIVTKDYVDGGSGFTGTAAGTNTYTTTLSTRNGATPVSQLALGRQAIIITFTSGNTGAATLNANGFGAQPIAKFGSNPLVGGEIPSGSEVQLIWDGFEYQLQNVTPLSFFPQRINIQTGNPLASISNSVTETTLFSYTLNGGVLTSGGILKIHAEGNYLNNAGGTESYSLKFYYGASAILLTNPTGITNSATPGFWIADITLANIGATNAQWGTMFHVSSADVADGASGGSNVYYLSRTSSSTTDSTTAQTVKLTVTLVAATATQTFTCYETHSQIQ